MNKLRVYTDGACSGNPGPGGWGAIFAYPIGLKQISGYEEKTTNNRMELSAVVKTLEEFIDVDYDENIDVIEINSDSAYVINAINQNWLKKWDDNGWVTTEDKPVKNCDLWQKLIMCFSELQWLGIGVIFKKVKGHSGNTLNELVDELARNEIVKNKK